MLLKTDLPLGAASTIVDRALEAGRAAGMAPLTVAVLDAGGHLVALKRADGSGILRPEIASARPGPRSAWGSRAGRSARACARRSRSSALAAASGGRFVTPPAAC